MDRKLRWMVVALGLAVGTFVLTSGIHVRSTVVMHSSQGIGPQNRVHIYNTFEHRCWYRTVFGQRDRKASGAGEDTSCELLAPALLLYPS